MIVELKNKLTEAFRDVFPELNAEVCRCDSEGIGAVMSFVDHHWKRGHILSHDIELIDFMHKSSDSNYNFILGKQKGAVGVESLLGYIPTSQYDGLLAEERDIWLAIWKSLGAPGSGLKLLEPLVNQYQTIAAIGINDHVARVYRWLGFSVFCLNQLYLLNPSCSSYSIASCGDDLRQASDVISRVSNVALIPLPSDEIQTMALHSPWRPRKSPAYVINRYLRHPIYSYMVFGVQVDGRLFKDCVFVTRKINVDGSSCMRLVDIIGNLSRCPNMRGAWINLLKHEGAEYIDCFESGLTNTEVGILGLDPLADNSGVVIPNYFEPFVRSNIRIMVALMNPTEDRYVMFKGDSDQDRPNRR